MDLLKKLKNSRTTEEDEGSSPKIIEDQTSGVYEDINETESQLTTNIIYQP